MSIPVSEIQWLQIANAAEALSPADREPFVTRIVRELEGKPIGEGTVARAVALSFKVFSFRPRFRACRRAGREANGPPPWRIGRWRGSSRVASDWRCIV
jgi:hypothetical protein